jgi:hypothetical protein
LVPLDGATAWRERAARSGGRARPRHVAPRWRAPSLAPASRVRGTPAAVRPPGVAPHGGSGTTLYGRPAPARARGSWRLSGAAPHSGSGAAPHGGAGAASLGPPASAWPPSDPAALGGPWQCGCPARARPLAARTRPPTAWAWPSTASGPLRGQALGQHGLARGRLDGAGTTYRAAASMAQTRSGALAHSRRRATRLGTTTRHHGRRGHGSTGM